MFQIVNSSGSRTGSPLFLASQLICIRPGLNKEDVNLLQEKASPHLLYILNFAEARASGQHGKDQSRKEAVQSIHKASMPAIKRSPSLLPPGWVWFLGGESRVLVLLPGHEATTASQRLTQHHLKNSSWKDSMRA